MINTLTCHFVKKKYDSIRILTKRRANAHAKGTGTLNAFQFLRNRSVGLLSAQIVS